MPRVVLFGAVMPRPLLLSLLLPIARSMYKAMLHATLQAYKHKLIRVLSARAMSAMLHAALANKCVPACIVLPFTCMVVGLCIDSHVDRPW